MSAVVERVERELRSAEARESSITAEISALKKARPQSDDFEGLVAHSDLVMNLQRRLEIARSVAEACGVKLAGVKAEAAAQEELRRYRLGETEAKAGEKRVRRIIERAAEQAEDLAWLAEHNARIDALNATRGERPPISTAEQRVRRTPGRFVPARYEEREMLIDIRTGEPCPGAVVVVGGKRVSAGQDARLEVRRVVVEPERSEPPKAPRSLVETVVLPGLRADDPPLWPPRGGGR